MQVRGATPEIAYTDMPYLVHPRTHRYTYNTYVPLLQYTLRAHDLCPTHANGSPQCLYTYSAHSLAALHAASIRPLCLHGLADTPASLFLSPS